MIPLFSRMFPGTNLQDLNLDWICRRIMELSKGIIAPWINPENQHWMVYDTAAETFIDSGVSAAGEGTGPQGEPGKSPVIGSNGNWYIWDTTTQAYTDTGTSAEGPEGPEGPVGPRADNNLLDNWYFVNPVNQRGLTTWQNAGDYTVDRWKLSSGIAALGASGLTLNGTLVQIREDAVGLPVTCSALLSDGTMITPTYNDTTKTFTLTATGQTIVAVKLEIGDTQTLAHQSGTAWTLNDMPDYGDQLVKCQRYYFDTGASVNKPILLNSISNISGTSVGFACPIPITMRNTQNFTVIQTLAWVRSNGAAIAASYDSSTPAKMLNGYVTDITFNLTNGPQMQPCYALFTKLIFSTEL